MLPPPRPAAGLLFAALTAAVLLVGQDLVGQDLVAQDATAPRYGRDVRPILADRCFRCHGPDAKTRAGDLRLDERDHALAPRGDGRPAIVPGDPAGSELWQRVRRHDDDRMPPPDSSKPPLLPHEQQVLERWIAAGAPYEAHWSFVPPQAPTLPAPAAADLHPIDRWLAAARTAARLAPSAPADPATLARRVFLVLTGLPPTPGELAAYVADARADAYERLVDRLLGDEPYRTRHAEHLAQLWLDAARYADTSGIHMDAGRQAWPWRDWLLRALRDDLPFDRFVVEQLAGDLLPNATIEQKVATGFLRNHVTTDEGGAIDEEYLVEYAAERTNTVGSVFLGLTLGCARCHDHKYDPIRQEDYYRLFAFFNSNREPGLYSQVPDSNRALEPFLQVPTIEQEQRRTTLRAELAIATAALDDGSPEEASAFAAFTDAVLRPAAGRDRWQQPRVVHAQSRHGATLTIGADGTVLASGANPAKDEHVLELAVPAGPDTPALRWLCLEALPDASLPHGKVGRASNGNVVLQRLQLQARPLVSDAPWQDVPLAYAMADVEQPNGDYTAGNVLDDDDRGWAVAAHQGEPRRAHLAVLAAAPFGHVDGTALRVVLRYDSVHGQHVFGRVRVHVAAADPLVLERLPLQSGGFHVAGPFRGAPVTELYDRTFGPERATSFDPRQRWGELRWRYDDRLELGRANGELPDGQNTTYVALPLLAPTARTVQVKLGSDDGFQLYVNGSKVAERRVDRGVAVDQDEATFDLPAGPSLLVLKVVNTGGAGGFAIRHVPRSDELGGDLRLLALPAPLAEEASTRRLTRAYREQHSPHHRARKEAVAALQRQLDELDGAIPRAMVMHEAEQPRPTFVLLRGEYDKPDRNRPVARELPAMFGALPADAPRDRLGLARWLTSEQNPLLLRVAVNRLWEFVFGTGLVRTSEDFGRQGEWPSHPELLDWLATEYRARGLSTRAMLRLLVTSEAFRQQSRRSDAAQLDPDNRLLAWFPRRRLPAEALRDQALFVGGLLVEDFGGPSVKPIQPAGLWQEVAMPQSNTRIYEAGSGQALWRRSLYTYWKRACPPPGLLTLDAPTREVCTIRRGTTNTPLQALVLWNDEQFVEAARALAQRTLAEAMDGDAAAGDDARLQRMHERCTGTTMPPAALAAARATLQTLRTRFAAAPADAEALLAVGSHPRNEHPAIELAPFIVLANAFLNLDATLCLP